MSAFFHGRGLLIDKHGRLDAAAFSQNGALVASATRGDDVDIWSVSDHSLVVAFESFGHHDYVYSVFFSPDNRLLATTSQDGNVKLWDVGTGLCAQTLDVYSGPVLDDQPEGVQSAAFLANSSRLLAIAPCPS